MQPVDIDAIGFFWCRNPQAVSVQIGGAVRIADDDIAALTGEVRRLLARVEDVRIAAQHVVDYGCATSSGTTLAQEILRVLGEI